jgi:histidine ammonia-lyase
MTELPLQLLGSAPLTTLDVVRVLDGHMRLELESDPAFVARIAAGADVVRRRVASGEPLYGVTTGFGDSCETRVEAELAIELQHNLVRYHGCGTGEAFAEREALAVLIVRLASLVRGYSGVRMELLRALCDLVDRRVLPRIPKHGSVGASGDLTPLSYVAALLVGERDASHRGEVLPARTALERAGLRPITLAPKEGLALMNGTSVMTAIGVVVWDRAQRYARFASALTAMAVDVLQGNRHHFDPRIDALKPHPGQRTCAEWIREDLDWDRSVADPGLRLQDRYSVRCAPHVVGVLLDAATTTRAVLDVEINSVNDNPLVDPDRGDFVNGGNFYGGHVAYALDALKTAVANVAGLLERQLALLCSTHTNQGLPANLVAPGPGAGARHGFKAMQITASALVAEAMKQTMPASVFSRSTECHNQDVVSMGLHSARDALAILDLAETTGAICALALAQGLELRGVERGGSRARALHADVRARAAFVEDDRAQDGDIVRVLEAYRRGELAVGSHAGSHA